MPKPTLAQRTSFKTWLRKYKTKFANTTIPEFYIDAILSQKAVGISTTDNVRVIPFDNFETVDISTDISNDSLFYLPALTNDRVTVSFGSTSLLLTFVGEDQGITYNGSTYTLNDDIPISRGKSLRVQGLGGALLQSSNAPIYDITPSTTSVNEGQSMTFTINTTDVAVGTRLYWNTLGSVTDDDFAPVPPNPNTELSGYFDIVSDGTSTGGIGTVTRILVAEPPASQAADTETFQIVIKTGSSGNSGIAVTTSSVVTINDVQPSYAVTADKTTIAESARNSATEIVTLTVATTNVANNSKLAWHIEAEPGSTRDSNDIGFWNGSTTSGVSDIFYTTNNSTTLQFKALYDWRENENDTFRITIRDTNTSTTTTGTALTFTTVQVTDVTPSLTLTQSTTTVDEGATVTFTLSGSAVPEKLYYATIKDVSGVIATTDFGTFNQRVGAGGVYGNSVNFSYSIVEDFITEGIEQFQVEIRTDGYATGSPVATSGVITINDTSRAPGSAANGLTFGPVQVNRDNGTVANATDWYKICNIDDLPEGSSIALFIDGSGSMTQATVQASYNAFVAKLNEKNITITTVTNGDEDWITPFLVDLP